MWDNVVIVLKKIIDHELSSLYISKVIFVGNEKIAILLAHCELFCSWTYWR